MDLLSNDNLESLAGYLRQTQSSNAEERRGAEETIGSIEGEQQFALALIKLIEMEAAGDNVRLAAAIYFKNFMKKQWTPGPDANDIISPADRKAIKENIVSVTLSLPHQLQTYMGDAVGIAAKHDYHEKWESLLPELVHRLQSNDMPGMIAILKLCNELFKRYRDKFKSDALFTDMLYSLNGFQEPLLEMFQGVSTVIEDCGRDLDTINPSFEALHIMAEIFYSLNCQDIPEFFEDHIDEWMGMFNHWLGYTNELMVPNGDEPSNLSKLQAAICENISLYTEVAEEVEKFDEVLPSFVEAIWNLLMRTTDQQCDDALVATAIHFLTSVSTTKVHSSLFQDPSTLKMVCESVVIPNLVFREQDENDFEMDPMEYIRRDIQAGDKETRRRAACDLVRGLCKHFEGPVTAIFSEYIGNMLQEFSASPDENWKQKDVAIYMTTALTVRTTTTKLGTTQTNDLVNITEFFAENILPDLQSANINSMPVLKADAIKFTDTFRNQLPKEALLAGFAAFVPLCTAENFVVQTYAANAIEKALTILEDNGARVIQKKDIQGHLEALLVNLFGLLENGSEREEQENPYVMRAIMRVCEVAEETVLPYTGEALSKLQFLLTRACKNPGDPTFNHCLFNTMAVFISHTCKTDVQQIVTFEDALFEPFTTILQQDIAEFMPYIFQLLAQLLEFRPEPVPDQYLALLEPLTTAELWTQTGNIPAMVRLLVAFTRIGGASIISMGLLEPIMGIFRKLMSSSVQDRHGFTLLNAIVSFIPLESLMPLMNTLLVLILTRLSNKKTYNITMGFTKFFSIFVAVHGPEPLLQEISNIPPGPALFHNILSSLYLDNVRKTVSDVDRKVDAVALTKLLTLQPVIEDVETWGAILVQLMKHLEEEREAAPESIQGPQKEGSGYDNKFSQLSSAPLPVDDPCPDISEPRAFFAHTLHELSKQYPGKFGPLLENGIEKGMLDCILGYFNAAGIREPYLA